MFAMNSDGNRNMAGEIMLTQQEPVLTGYLLPYVWDYTFFIRNVNIKTASPLYNRREITLHLKLNTPCQVVDNFLFNTMDGIKEA